jgi:hypothetical protein
MFNTNPDKPFTSEELDRLGIDVQNGRLIAVDVPTMRHGGPAFQPIGMILSGAPIPKAVNLLTAAPILYQAIGTGCRALSQVHEALQTLDAVLADIGKSLQEEAEEKVEFVNVTGLAESVEMLQTFLMDIRRCAEVGVMNVAEAHRKELKLPVDKGAPKG